MDKIKNYITNNKKKFIVILFLFLVIIILYLIWSIYLGKKYIFSKQEKNFYEAGQLYFEQNSKLLPKTNKSVRSVTLGKLVDKDYLENIYIPKTIKSCDLNNSWLKVINNNGKYNYYVYLECGNFKSKTDHIGPKITLNGKNELIVDQNKGYIEPGIKEIIDDTDKNIDIKNTTITGDVDTSKVGIYKIKYTAFDSLMNKTEKIRTVRVVKLVESIVKENTKNNTYFGNVNNNYVLYSGMLWRIVKVNNDKSIKIVMENSISNITYGSTTYDQSNVNYWLNKYFYKKLNNTSYIKKDSTWCLDNVSNIKSKEEKCTTEITSPIGMLSVSEWNNSINNSETYLANSTYSMLLNKKNDSTVYAFNGIGVEEHKNEDFLTVRPAVNLNKGIYIIDGDGTYDNPYKFNDYEYGKDNSYLNKRLIGEYVNFSGYLWRVLDIDSENNTTLIMSGIMNDPNNNSIYIGYNNNQKIKSFNVEEKGNIGYILNKELIDYILDDYLIKTSWTVPTINLKNNFNTWDTSKVSSYLSLPKSYDLFSTTSNNHYWLIDSSSKEGNIVFKSNCSLAYEESLITYNEQAIKLVAKLNNKVKIGKGKGTYQNPYKVK